MSNLEAISMRSTSAELFGQALAGFAQECPELMLIDAGVGEECNLHSFRALQPKNVLSVSDVGPGIVTAAAGLASVGFVPWICCLDDACLSVPPAEFLDAEAVGDVKILCFPSTRSSDRHQFNWAAPSVSGVTILAPADAAETIRAMRAILKLKGLVFLQAQARTTPHNPNQQPFEIGKGVLIREGRDVTLVACANLLEDVLEAAECLERDGTSVRIVHLATLEPLDRELLMESVSLTGALVIADYRTVAGGAGAAISVAIASGHPCPVEFVGLEGKRDRSVTERAAVIPIARALADGAKRAIARKSRRKSLR